MRHYSSERAAEGRTEVALAAELSPIATAAGEEHNGTSIKA